jgi:hypothetical protein
MWTLASVAAVPTGQARTHVQAELRFAFGGRRVIDRQAAAVVCGGNRHTHNTQQTTDNRRQPYQLPASTEAQNEVEEEGTEEARSQSPEDPLNQKENGLRVLRQSAPPRHPARGHIYETGTAGIPPPSVWPALSPFTPLPRQGAT